MIEIKKFLGMTPAIPDLQAPGSARIARDVKLWHGDLRPWREPHTVHECSIYSKTIHLVGCCWLCFDKCVSVAHDRGECPKVAITGRMPYPEQSCNFDDCVPKWCRLCVPAPKRRVNQFITPEIVELTASILDRRLTAVTWTEVDGVLTMNVAPELENETTSYSMIPLTPVQQGAYYNGWLAAPAPLSGTDYADSDLQAVSYVYTFVNSCCQEGPPSYPTVVKKVLNDGWVTVSGWEQPDPSYCIEKIRLYRSASPFVTGREQTQESRDEYLRVAEIPIGQGVFIDDLDDIELGPALETRGYCCPPNDLQGILYSEEANRLVGYSGRKIRMSQQGEWHNWPENLELTLDFDISGIAEKDGLLYAATKGNPFVIKITGDCQGPKCFDVHKYDEALPAAACCGDKGITVTPFGAIYAGQDGLVLLASKKATVITTPAFFDTDDWSCMAPNTMKLAWWKNGLFIAGGRQSYILQIPGSSISYSNTPSLTEISDVISDVFVSDTGIAYILRYPGEIRQWDAGVRYRPFLWESNTFHEGGRLNRYSVAHVDGKELLNCQVGLVCGEHSLLVSRAIGGCKTFRIPRSGLHREHRVRFTGTGIISYAQLRGTFT